MKSHEAPDAKVESAPAATDPSRVTRREFAALSLAAAVGTAVSASASAADVQDHDVVVTTPSGRCDAALVRPGGKGPWPVAILFTDALGLRPAMRQMAARLAADGYVVLVPNPYYRAAKAPGLPADFDFANPAGRARLAELRKPLTNDGVQSDVRAYLAYLDAQPFVRRGARVGAFGYCMGGTMTLQAAGTLPERIGAGASFHGGGLVTDAPDSPHRLIPRMHGAYLVAIAANDDAKQPEAKTALREAFAAAHVPATVEVYPGTRHGWCVRDMPLQEGTPVYDEAQAERAWTALTALFRRQLA